MPAQGWFRLTMVACLLTAVGCQSAAPTSWKFWQQAAQSDRTRGLKDPVRTHIAYGHLQEQAGNLDDARESYEIALQSDAKSVDALVGLARLDVLGGRPKEAERRFEQALQMAPLNVHVLETTGQFFVAQGRYDEAVKLLGRAVDADPNNKKLRSRLAVAMARSGDIRGAEQHFVQAVGVAEADYNIGVILYENGNLVQAEQRLQRALAAKPSLAPAQHWLSEIQAELANGRTVAQTPPAVPTANAGVTPAPIAPAPQAAQSQSTASQVATPFAQPASPAPASYSAAPLGGNGITPSSGVMSPSTAPLDLNRMSAAQLEQLENSMSPVERDRFRDQLRIGQVPNGLGY